MKVRCSSLPRFFACASSAGEARNPINSSSDESDLGTAAHECLALVVLGQEPDVAGIAKRFGVEADELDRLVAYGRKAWGKLKQYFPSPRVEQKIDDENTPGTADVAHADGETLVVLDWKSGRNRRNYQEQLCGYGNIARRKYGMPSSGKVVTIVVWLRYLEADVEEWTAEELDAWEQRFQQQAELVGRQYAAGEHCGFCPLRLECEAHRGYIATSAAALTAQPAQALTPERLALLYPQAQMLERALDDYKTTLRTALADGRVLPIGDGRTIALVEQGRTEIDAQAAWPILKAEGFDEGALNTMLTLSKGALEEAVGARAPKGMKGKAKAAMIDRLKQAGAAQTATFTKLETRKA